MKQQMYIGPSIPGIVKRGTVFLGELPRELTDAVTEMACIGNLVVPIDGITAAQKELSQQGSVKDVSYRQAEQYKRGEK